MTKAGRTAGTPEPGLFFSDLVRTFEAAAPAPETRTFRVAGLPIRLVFAGPPLIPRLMPALEHHPPADKPELTIRIWDSASTGTRMPPPAWDPSAYGPRGEIRGFNTSRFRTAFIPGENVLSMLDLETGEGLCWIRDARELPTYLTGAPLRPLLAWWLVNRGIHLVHGAAIGHAERGALIGGPGGSGKSTTAVSCLQAGLQYAGDDYVLVNPDGPAVYSLYNSAKLDRDHLERFSGLEGTLRVENKRLLFFPGRTVDRIPLSTVIIPRISTGAASTSTLSSAEALKALAPSTIFQQPLGGESSFRSLAGLIRQLPCFRLDLGADLTRIPSAVRGILDA